MKQTPFYHCRTIVAIIAILLLSCMPLFATDRSTYWNLGFSHDGLYVMFGQYWVSNTDSSVTGELNIVNTAQNRFVPNGKITSTDRRIKVPTSDGRNIIVALALENSQLIEQYGIDAQNEGRVIYLDLDDSQLNESINFVDYDTGNRYSIDLNQNRDSSSAAFSIRVNVVKANGGQFVRTIGIPNLYRDGVLRYEIQQIIVHSASNAHIFVVEQLVDSDSSSSNISTRYMIETVLVD